MGAEVPGSFCLFLLLLQSALQVSFSLRQLQLQPQHFGLLSLEGRQDGRKKRGLGKKVKRDFNCIELNKIKDELGVSTQEILLTQSTGRCAVPPKPPQTLPVKPVTPPSPSQSSSLLSGAHGHFYLHLRAGL